MSFRRKLLAVSALTVFVSVAAVAWIITNLTRRAFEREDSQRTIGLIAEFQRGYTQRADDLARRLESIATSDAVIRLPKASASTISNSSMPTDTFSPRPSRRRCLDTPISPFATCAPLMAKCHS